MLTTLIAFSMHFSWGKRLAATPHSARRSEDGTVRIWHSTTYRLESTLNYGLERVWALGYIKGSNS